MSKGIFALRQLAAMLTSALISIGCASFAPDITTPTDAATTTPTPQPTDTPTVTASPTASPTPGPTPEFGAGRVGEDFLFGNQPEGCTLPCWQGLRVGVSTARDVQVMFDNVLAFHGSQDFFASATPMESVPEIAFARNFWTLAPINSGGEPGTFGIGVYLDTRDQTLQGINLHSTSDRFAPAVGPQRILRELGAPSTMLTSTAFYSPENMESGHANLLMIYDSGLTFFYSNTQIRINRGSNKGSAGVATYCLGDPMLGLGGMWASVTITGPFTDGLHNLTPLQDALVANDLRRSNPTFESFEKVFDISPKQAADLAQQEGAACIYKTVLPVQ